MSVIHTSDGGSTNHSSLFARLRDHELARRLLDCPVISVEVMLNLLQKEVSGESKTSREDNQLGIQHTAEIHTADTEGLSGNLHALVSKHISGLGSIHNLLGSERLLVAQHSLLLGVLGQVLLGLEHQSVGGSVFLIASLLTTTARSTVSLVDLPSSSPSTKQRLRSDQAHQPIRFLRG